MGWTVGGRQRAAKAAAEIEVEMNKVVDSVTSTKAYGDKARSLKYNLDTNQDLRYRVIIGHIEAAELGEELGTTSLDG